MVKISLSDEQKNIFLDGMLEIKKTGNIRNPFVLMAEIILSFNARQLCHFWRNYLDPDVCKGNLEDEEKAFIDKWIPLNRTKKGGIEWRILRIVLKEQFGRFRSENMIKNYHYSKNRRKAVAPYPSKETEAPAYHPSRDRRRVSEAVDDVTYALSLYSHQKSPSLDDMTYSLSLHSHQKSPSLDDVTYSLSLHSHQKSPSFDDVTYSLSSSTLNSRQQSPSTHQQIQSPDDTLHSQQQSPRQQKLDKSSQQNTNNTLSSRPPTLNQQNHYSPSPPLTPALPTPNSILRPHTPSPVLSPSQNHHVFPLRGLSHIPNVLHPPFRPIEDFRYLFKI